MTTIQIRTDEKTKASAQRVLKKLGLDLSTAINIYLVQIVQQQGVPFEIRTENGFTPAEEKQILKEYEEARKSKKSYASAEEMHRDILGK
ncbi:MAG TPA: type II toxin-antitoxin system RelB/DinJ family antitoxin [Candidatus Peribacteraceae bacterium]|nr:type II toxin-antitoxin system RelB/DinJ family antitoxin [Candidatus Peribacteraceae bacterium]